MMELSEDEPERLGFTGRLEDEKTRVKIDFGTARLWKSSPYPLISPRFLSPNNATKTRTTCIFPNRSVDGPKKNYSRLLPKEEVEPLFRGVPRLLLSLHSST
jgi:hypothetical protein